MKSLISALCILFAQSAFAYQAQQLDCRMITPACQQLFFITSSSDIDFSMSLDSENIDISAKLTYSADHSVSTLTVMLTDALIKRSESKTYSVADNTSLMGGVEQFIGSNGVEYSIICNAVHFDAGVSIRWTDPCGPNH